MTLPWRNGYEHYAFDEAASHASGRSVYRWIYHTDSAE